MSVPVTSETSTHFRQGNAHRRGQKNEKYRDGTSSFKQDKEINMSSPVIQAFMVYQVELDAKHDKYERLVKKSRDVTIESKRIIFLLHRVTSDKNKEAILDEAKKRLAQLHTMITKDIGSELIGEDIFRFLRAFSPGLQEYVEAVTFFYYLKDHKLVSLEELCCDENIGISADEETETMETPIESGLKLSTILTPMDYILGVADLTGELMRKCINSVGNGDLKEPFNLCLVLLNIYHAFLLIGNRAGRELSRKISVLRSSLQKVENACYAIQVRGTETPKHMLAELLSHGGNSEDISDATVF